ncbi:uncharacterized protein EMH_0035520 [Eimeria mitis]|uniref:Uncharacterized protein n=1 Tax=Eimeria mitis TaxID=44415 RepID=U6JUZ4_9EIME|nr:uncharacterized protein EMH_0035520 [Eimeria mitis]CDJ27857.1 hypothetical protein, conserved [Eimeria mitis]
MALQQQTTLQQQNSLQQQRSLQQQDSALQLQLQQTAAQLDRAIPDPTLQPDLPEFCSEEERQRALSAAVAAAAEALKQEQQERAEDEAAATTAATCCFLCSNESTAPSPASSWVDVHLKEGGEEGEEKQLKGESMTEQQQQVMDSGVSNAKEIDLFGPQDLDFINQELSAAHKDLYAA